VPYMMSPGNGWHAQAALSLQTSERGGDLRHVSGLRWHEASDWGELNGWRGGTAQRPRLGHSEEMSESQSVADPAEFGYVDVNGLHMYYETHGDGSPWFSCMAACSPLS